MPTIYNKVTINGDTLIDLSGDTVSSAADIVAGKVGHLNTGATVTGTASGGTDFMVELAYNESTDIWSPACTLAEIQSAYSSGKNICTYAHRYYGGFERPEVSAGNYESNDQTFYYQVIYEVSYDASHSKTAKRVHYYYLDSSGVHDDEYDTYVDAYSLTTKTITENGSYNALDENPSAFGYASVTVNVPSSGSSKNFQIAQGVDRVATTTYTAVTGQEITVAKTGTYDVYWTGFRSSTSGTSGSQLYINDEAYGTAQTTFTNHGQSVHLSNVSLSQGDVVTIRARARNTSYFMYVGNLTIIES